MKTVSFGEDQELHFSSAAFKRHSGKHIFVWNVILCLFFSGRVDYCYTEATPIEDGTHKFTVYFDLKLNLDLMYSYLHNGKLYDASEFIAAKERISDMNSLGSSGTSGQEEAGTSFKYFKPQFGNRTVSQLKCSGCGVSGRGQKLMACKGCEKAWYCGRECQLADWKSHKIECKKAGQRS